jgi:hypothetical protein
MSVEIENDNEGAVRIRIQGMRIPSQYEVALAIPDLETSGSPDPDLRKVAQHWQESDCNCESGSGPTVLQIADSSHITF